MMTNKINVQKNQYEETRQYHASASTGSKRQRIRIVIIIKKNFCSKIFLFYFRFKLARKRREVFLFFLCFNRKT